MNFNTGLVPVIVLFFSVPAVAGELVTNFQDAIVQTILNSPQVQASWYNFEASREAQRAARGGYYPSVDVDAQIGRERRSTPLAEQQYYSPDAIRISITQMLFDGFETRYEVDRLGYANLSDYYQLKATSEALALDAAVAYFNTVRFQKLVVLAKDNYVVHRQVYDKIAERTGGGLSQGVDLEQASGRVALSESNLLTEMTNLHDVQARFQNIVGSLPAEGLELPIVPTGLIPGLRSSVLNMAYNLSPEIDTAIENLRAAQSALNATNAPMMPRVDLRFRDDVEHNTDGFNGRFDERAIELVGSYNLYRGGSDSARKREANNFYYAAIEERNQTCLNVRQNVTIAYNEIKALEKQIIYLDQSQLSQDKTRKAYDDQFDLGRRTLLDVLDSQNEYFDTQRAYVSALADLAGAQARTLSNMGILTKALNVEGLNQEQIDQLNLDLARVEGEDGASFCPPEAAPAVEINREALFASLIADADDSRYRIIDETHVALDTRVEFEFNSSIISRSFDTEIAEAAQFLSSNPLVTGVLEGHTDSIGQADYNLWLSERRANAVRNMLIDKYQVNPEQITAVGYGLSRPLADNDSIEGQAQNRRVDLTLDSSAVP